MTDQGSSEIPLVRRAAVTWAGPAAAAAALVATAALALWGAGTEESTRVPALVAVLLVAVGSPHGAMDHVALLGDGSAGHGRGWRAVVPDRRLAALYLGVAGVALLAYLAAPTVGFAVFLILSALHFGAGETGFDVDRGVARGFGDPLGWAAGLGGAVVVAVPLASPGAAAAVAAVDPRLVPVLAHVPVVAAVVVMATLVSIGLAAAAAVARRDRGSALVAAELCVLLALAWLAHPLLAFGAYFAGWHALRHQARLADLAPPAGAPPLPADAPAGRVFRRVARSAVPGLPATAAVLLTAVPLVVWGQSLLGALLALVWALTVPHTAAVAVMEVRRARARRRFPRRGRAAEVAVPVAASGGPGA